MVALVLGERRACEEMSLAWELRHSEIKIPSSAFGPHPCFKSDSNSLAFPRALLAAIPGSPCDAQDDHGHAGFHKNFFSVERIDRGWLQGWVGEYAVEEEAGGSGIGEIVKTFPEWTSELDAIYRSDNNDQQQIDRHCADRVFQRLLRRPEGKSNIHYSKGGRAGKQKRKGMEQRCAQGDITCPAVQPKNVKPPMRPEAHRAVTSPDQQANANVERGKAYCNQANVGG